MNKKSYLAILAAVLLSACSSTEEPEPVPSYQVTQKVLELSMPSTRSAFEGGEGDGTHPITWTKGDKIGILQTAWSDVLGMEIDVVHPFTVYEGIGTSNGKFKGYAREEEVYHLTHPFQKWNYVEKEKTMHMILPSIQTATPNTYDPTSVLMVGRAVDSGEGENATKSGYLRNVVSWIRIKPKYDCQVITIETTQPNEYLTGTVDVNFNNGEPTWTPAVWNDKSVGGRKCVAMSRKVTLQGDIKAGTNYYISVLPGPVQYGFTVTEETCDGIGTKTLVKNFTLQRSLYHDFSGMQMDQVEEKYVDLGTSVMWATRNLGAAHDYLAGDYYAWGEIAAAGYNDPENKNLMNNYGTQTKFFYNWESYKWGDGSDIGHDRNAFSKYNGTDRTELEDEDDAAYNPNCGRRMPTKAEFEELMAKCYWEHTDNYLDTQTKGFIIYKRKEEDTTERIVANYQTTNQTYSLEEDVHIFLPFGGFFQNTYVVNENTVHGYYWCRDVYDTPNPGKKTCYYEKAYDLLIGYDEGDTEAFASIHCDNRRGGQSIRPVRDF